LQKPVQVGSHQERVLGQSLFSSETQREKYFGNNDFKPKYDNKTVKHYCANELIMHQINEIAKVQDVDGSIPF
jgi:hypothetical protein